MPDPISITDYRSGHEVCQHRPGHEKTTLTYRYDDDHDSGTCAIYECRVCGHMIHFELPD